MRDHEDSGFLTSLRTRQKTTIKKPTVNASPAPIIETATTNERHLETLPVSPELLGRADWWYDVSWYGLIVAASAAAISAFATVAFTLFQFWSGGVLDRHTEWRTATLERETALAKLDLGKAQERIAELGNETAQANERAAEANKVAAEATLQLEKMRTPRRLSETQR